ncbi:MAG: flavin-containing monooxygenase, partial [Solirubrobacterales bacterium]
LEGRETFGGTWDLFRYPGIRSDSDLQTFGFTFKPWTDDEAIAGGEAIRSYIAETVDERGLMEHIRFGHRATKANWSSETSRWEITATDSASAEEKSFTASWLFVASGYYNYERGYKAEIPDIENFAGPIVHPQFWDDSLDMSEKRVVVIGSGATAVTLVPALAAEGADVTMLQRSPTYIMSAPSKDPIANALRRFFGDDRGHQLARSKNIWITNKIYKACQRYPKQMAWLIRRSNRNLLPRGFDVDQHFRPNYGPWDQRMCLVPDGDLFEAISDGKADVVTDRIRTFTDSSIILESGRELKADIVVTATGLEILLMGGLDMTIDGEDIDAPSRFSYKGMMISGVPNMGFALGYVNASWTLKVELVAQHLCRLLSEMDARGAEVVVAEPPPNPDESLPLLDFQAGYIQRAVDDFPRQGTMAPWKQSMDYYEDVGILVEGEVGDHMTFTAASQRVA